MVGNIYISGGAGVVTYEGAKELQLGNTTGSSVNSANLVNINLGGTYHDTAGSFGKLKLYDDGNDEISLGVSNNSCDFILTSGAWGYNFYGGNSGTTRLMSLNQVANGSIVLGSESSAGVAAPLSINLGGTYSDADGNGNDLSAKLKLWTDGSNLMGLSVSDSQLEFIVTEASYDHVFYGGSAGTDELARITGGGKVGINTASPNTALSVYGSVNVTKGLYGRLYSGATTIDTGIMVGELNNFSHGVLEVIVSGNPNHFGSGYYRASSTYMVHISTGWTGSALSTRIRSTRISYGDGGSSNNSEVTATFHLYDATTSTESNSGVARNSNDQLRIKIAGTSTASGIQCFVKILSNAQYLQ